jgi:triacylglycerol lipase
MYKLYQKINLTPADIFYWWLDYLYVARRQLFALIDRTNPTSYIRTDKNAKQIILIPGIYERWQFMKPVIDLLHAQGYSVHVVESLGMNAGTVESMADLVTLYARSQNLSSCSIVAHSKGGLIAKYLLGKGDIAIEKVVTINTPFGGSRYAKWFPLKALRTFMPDSRLLKLLSLDSISNNKITSIYGIFDPHIPGGSYLEGASNVKLNVRGHFRILNDPEVHREIVKNVR